MPAPSKLLVTARALRLRRDRPELFTGYAPLPADGSAAEHVVAFDRGGAVTVATRLRSGSARGRGLARHDAGAPPPATWTDVLTADVVVGGATRLADLLAAYPVALLVRRCANVMTRQAMFGCGRRRAESATLVDRRAADHPMSDAGRRLAGRRPMRRSADTPGEPIDYGFRLDGADTVAARPAVAVATRRRARAVPHLRPVGVSSGATRRGPAAGSPAA